MINIPPLIPPINHQLVSDSLVEGLGVLDADGLDLAPTEPTTMPLRPATRLVLVIIKNQLEIGVG